MASLLLLAEALRVTGLGQGLSAGLARWRAPRAVHDPGKIMADLAVALGLGGDCLALWPAPLDAPCTASRRAGGVGSAQLQPAGRRLKV
jgi:hypothetical protein